MSDLLPIYDLDAAREGILKRLPPDEISLPPAMQASLEASFGPGATPDSAVRAIISDVRTRGDAALREWTQKLDRADLRSFTLGPPDFDAAAKRLSPALLAALQVAAERIRAFYQRQPLTAWFHPDDQGFLGQLILPLDSVGVYVPGGSAPLPSTLLMCAIPAQVAGVRRIVACTPPGLAGRVPDVILAAAQVAGIDSLYVMGGAQAIAVLAYGTESIHRVDKIVGPGNLFVTLAKRQVYGAVGIDGIFGPTEVMIIADEAANPTLVAADLLAQAEHDPIAQAILVTPDRALAQAVQIEIARQLESLSRAEIISQSLPGRGGAVIVPDLDTAFEVANAYGAEHLQLSLRDPQDWLGRVRHAGAVFLGEYSYEVLGDYVAGPSHSLPTGGSARYASGLNLIDFIKVTSVIGLNREAAGPLSQLAAILARSEGLDGHAAAADARGSGA